MKKLLTYLSFVFLLNMYAQWEVQDTGLNAYFIDIHCITADTVIVSGENGTILRTIDGGLVWNQVASPVTVDLNKIEFINSDIGFILGTDNTLLKTTDAGENWQIINTNFSDNILNISCTDTSIFVSGENAMLYKSNDYGVSWTAIPTGLTGDLSISMEDDNTGFVQLDNVLYKTTDGGYSWDAVTCANNIYAFYTDQSNGIFMNEYNYFLTGDAFQTCHTIDSPTEAYSFNNKFTFIDNNSFWYPANILGCMFIYPVAVKYEYDENTGTGQYTYCELYEIALPYYDSLNEMLTLSDIDSYNETVYIISESTGLIFKNPTGMNCNDYVNAIENNEAEVFSIYPNPGKGVFQIDTKNLRNASYSLYDTQGKEILEPVSLLSDRIDLSFLPAGVYYFNLITAEGTYTRKLVIE